MYVPQPQTSPIPNQTNMRSHTAQHAPVSNVAHAATNQGLHLSILLTAYKDHNMK